MQDETGSTQSTSEKQWDAARYDGGHSFVWKYGAGVIEFLAPREGEQILDIGCGTGHLTAEIARRGARVVGIDISPAMLEQARKSYPDLQFELMNATNFRFDESFDAIFSNAAIHWIKDQDSLTESISRALKAGGRFVAEFGGKGNLRAVKAALHRAIEAAGYTVSEEAAFRYYPSVGEYATLLEHHRLSVRKAYHFERPTALEGGDDGLRNWLEVFADNEMSAVPASERDGIIRAVKDELRPTLFRDGKWFIDYRRLRVVAVKES
ncbi:MAG TPA: methyltransferase domain-containing protein [Blastocatellia bacterium]|nr:methyltransferase domain-containing protein [Blastocatellia bacterium]